MRLTVLVDNNTFIDEYYVGEPALSYYIEDGDKSILFDTGYSDVYIRNAEKIGLDLSFLSTVVFSHGHNDHTGGLIHLINRFPQRRFEIVAHPDALRSRACDGKHIGIPLTKKELDDMPVDLCLSETPIKLSQNLTFLGEIPILNDFELRQGMGHFEEKESNQDFVMDDSAIVYQGDKGLFIITGCSHSGICNIIEYAKKICDEKNILGVIGGFHLFEPSDKLSETIKYFQDNHIENLYPCHCVSFKAKAEIHKRIPIQEVGVGMRIEIQ